MQNTIINSLNGENLNFRYLKEEPGQVIVHMGMRMNTGSADIYIDHRIKAHQVIIIAIPALIIPENMRKKVAEYVNLANNRLILGNLEVNMINGEVRCRYAFVYDPAFPLSKKIFLRNLYTCIQMLDDLLPGIMTVTYGHIEPDIALDQCMDIVNPRLN